MSRGNLQGTFRVKSFPRLCSLSPQAMEGDPGLPQTSPRPGPESEPPPTPLPEAAGSRPALPHRQQRSSSAPAPSPLLLAPSCRETLKCDWSRRSEAPPSGARIASGTKRCSSGAPEVREEAEPTRNVTAASANQSAGKGRGLAVPRSREGQRGSRDKPGQNGTKRDRTGQTGTDGTNRDLREKPGPTGQTGTGGNRDRNRDRDRPPSPASIWTGTASDRSHRGVTATGTTGPGPVPPALATLRFCLPRSFPRWPRRSMSHAVLLLRRLRERRRHRNRDSGEEQDWGGDQHGVRDQDLDRDQHRDRHRARHQNLDEDRDHPRHRDENHERDRAQGWAQDQHHSPDLPARISLPAPSAAPPSPSPSPRRGRRRRPYPAQRIYRVRCSFLELSEEQALRRCRLDRAAIAALCRELGADLQSLTGRSHALPVAVKVTSALAFLASGSFQTASRLSTGISQSAMSNCLAQFLAALQRRAPRYIAFPPPPAPPGDPPALPGVLGLVGAMHVALRAPADNEPLFRNAANFHSINMQVVCDRHGAITNVVAKFPGSCANATVLENSALARLMEGSRMEGVWLLGDRTYPLKPWLLTPISGPRGAAELRYNALHSRTLDPLRRTLGLLRHRFRCLAGGGLQYSPPKVCQIFLACCILHNIALRRRVPLEPPEGLPPAPGHPEPPPQPPPPPGPGSREGRAVRARVVQQYPVPRQNGSVTPQ
ncbi:uncharacterized protein LOC117009249 [Catharus ustulatus]|uniref:uncharacterized protein LOC117009249 n=1 Tax=Catharus ustulatus TaxID=91951 RepID=UPI00140A9CF9|nr:uncharacterized protein LOC117009249 [Catharus ustulatus]